MVCIIIGFETTDKAMIHDQLLALPLDVRDGLVTGLTDFEHDFVGFVLLDMGLFGVDRVNEPIDIIRITDRITALGYYLNRSDYQVAEITTLELSEAGL